MIIFKGDTVYVMKNAHVEGDNTQRSTQKGS